MLDRSMRLDDIPSDVLSLTFEFLSLEQRKTAAVSLFMTNFRFAELLSTSLLASLDQVYFLVHISEKPTKVIIQQPQKTTSLLFRLFERKSRTPKPASPQKTVDYNIRNQVRCLQLQYDAHRPFQDIAAMIQQFPHLRALDLFAPFMVVDLDMQSSCVEHLCRLKQLTISGETSPISLPGLKMLAQVFSSLDCRIERFSMEQSENAESFRGEKMSCYVQIFRNIAKSNRIVELGVPNVCFQQEKFREALGEWLSNPSCSLRSLRASYQYVYSLDDSLKSAFAKNRSLTAFSVIGSGALVQGMTDAFGMHDAPVAQLKSLLSLESMSKVSAERHLGFDKFESFCQKNSTCLERFTFALTDESGVAPFELIKSLTLLRSLKHIHVHQSNTQTLIDVLKVCPSVESVHVSLTNFPNDAQAAELAELFRNIKRLDFGSNTGVIPWDGQKMALVLSQAHKLRALTMSMKQQCDSTNEFLAVLAKLSRHNALRELSANFYFASTAISLEVLRQLVFDTKLHTLVLEGINCGAAGQMPENNEKVLVFEALAHTECRLTTFHVRIPQLLISPDAIREFSNVLRQNTSLERMPNLPDIVSLRRIGESLDWGSDHKACINMMESVREPVEELYRVVKQRRIKID